MTAVDERCNRSSSDDGNGEAMKQLMIFCSPDLESRIISVLSEAGVEGFLHLPGGSANLFTDPGQVPRTLTWEANLVIVPAAADETVLRVADRLDDYARSCATESCLRYAVTTVERSG